MAPNSFRHFKSGVKTVCTARAPAPVAKVISEMIRDGSWTIPNSYIVGAFKRCSDTSSDTEIRDIVVKYLAEKDNGNGGNGSNNAQSSFKNVSKILKGENVKGETWTVAVDEMEAALSALYAKRNTKMPESVRKALLSVRDPK